MRSIKLTIAAELRLFQKLRQKNGKMQNAKWSTTFRPHYLPLAKSFNIDRPLMLIMLEDPFNIIYKLLLK